MNALLALQRSLKDADFQVRLAALDSLNRIAPNDERFLSIWRDLHVAEHDARLPETRRPDPGFTAAIHGWALGNELADVLDDEEMTGGDFVRNVKQLIDLLRQLGDVAPEPATAKSARDAADRLFRGVVAASSVVGS